jgi:hypothetical protein
MNTTSTVTQPTSFGHAFRHPSAFVPILMSLAALTLVLIHIARYGSGREADEGTAAHLWQLLMGLQLPIIGFFAVRWVPLHRSAGLAVLVAQLVAGLAAVAPVWHYHL